MTVDLYAQAFEKAGTDVVTKSLERLMGGHLSEFGGSADYTQLEKDFARALAPHFAGLYADFWNNVEMEAHDVYDATGGQFYGYRTAAAIADYVALNVQATDMDFTIRHIPDGQSETDVALDFVEMFNKLKGDFCEIIRVTSQEKQDSMRKLVPDAPKLEAAAKPKPSGPKDPYTVSDDPYA
ncbi:MAG: hypothetical protein EP349_01735 [Alphaproteobacteria bacterium]|nr:MAG: hypothetical protein EP349_01735 [Alphaproteobacteria bacterium]